ncbi:hypothetical protein SAMN04488112_10774 [Melghirimyces thermohalophilus]|uniref:Uncharacterized protein n=1 Tax=Melghirimyces thermohalophilus TaxID=1236220 RepID=A0A1G6L6K4_9BACL|nr:hypothetical protein [Melghirimyces thermohalophilus]SDC38874.1 hypothetical protein SAMN04488112_10774 [Melghirimyces thermohalophilus]
MNRSRWIAGSYHLLTVLATLAIPLLIFFGSRNRGSESAYGVVGAILAFVLLSAYLIFSNMKRGR